MSGGPKRIADKVNTVGIVMIGICGAVLVYVSIAALQAFYSNDIADVQTMADYGGQERGAIDLRAAQIGNITNVASTGKTEIGPTYQIKIDDAMKLVVAQAKVDASNLVPMVGPQKTATILPVFGRPKAIPAAPVPAAPTEGSGSGSGSAAAPAAPATGSGSGSATH